jgi:hypothetical protein
MGGGSSSRKETCLRVSNRTDRAGWMAVRDIF